VAYPLTRSAAWLVEALNAWFFSGAI